MAFEGGGLEFVSIDQAIIESIKRLEVFSQQQKALSNILLIGGSSTFPHLQNVLEKMFIYYNDYLLVLLISYDKGLRREFPKGPMWNLCHCQRRRMHLISHGMELPSSPVYQYVFQSIKIC